MSKESKATIKIPRPLFRKIRSLIDGSGFDSVTDFVVYVLRDIVASVERRDINGEEGQLTSDEVENVRKRLKNLGYL